MDIGFIERSRTVIRNLPYLPRVILPWDRTAPFSELEPANYETPRHFISAVRAALIPVYAPFRHIPHLPYEVPKEGLIEDDQIWFFLNGICTDRSVLRLHGKALAECFGRKIHLMHNPSDGIVLDLLECALGRTLQIMSTLNTSVADILEGALETHDKVVLIAHSQGGIIATCAVYLLLDRLKGERQQALERLELYTFAGAATELRAPEIHTEHFFNSRDYVARIGVGSAPERFSGRLFQRDATGHLLNTHYLEQFVRGEYHAEDGKPSRLSGYLRTRTTPKVVSIHSA